MSETDSIRKAFREKGIDQWDIYVEQAEEYEVQLRNFDVEIVRGPVRNAGYAVRVVKAKGKKVGVGIATGASTEPESVARCLEAASIGAEITEFPGYAMPKPSDYPAVKISDPKITSNAEALVLDEAEELVSLLGQNKNVLPTFGKIRTYDISTHISNSEGLEAEKTETLIFIELALKAEEQGRLAEFWPMLFVRRADDLRLADQIPRWTKLAEDALSAKAPKTMKTTVIFAPQILGNMLSSTIGFHTLSSSVYRGISKFKKNDEVVSSELTVCDDGIVDYGLGSSPFDDEGTPQRKTTVIENGIHKNYLTDATYAAALVVDSTGNGQKLPAYSLAFTRADLKYSMLPMAQPTNLVVKPGDMDLEEMIASTKEGIYLEQLSSASSDSLTASFGSEIRNAYLIDKGELTTPLKTGQINGFMLDYVDGKGQNAKGLLKHISGIANNAQISERCITPHIRFEGVQVTGR